MEHLFYFPVKFTDIRMEYNKVTAIRSFFALLEISLALAGRNRQTDCFA